MMVANVEAFTQGITPHPVLLPVGEGQGEGLYASRFLANPRSLRGASMTLRITILGCGASMGVPRIGNDWGACNPNNPKNRRRRCSVLAERIGPGGVTSVLFDTSPDLREQLLSVGVKRLDGVVYTHDHADHTHGIDDLRFLSYMQHKRIDIWADPRTLALLKQRFDYCFDTPPGSNYPPILSGHPIENSGARYYHWPRRRSDRPALPATSRRYRFAGPAD